MKIQQEVSNEKLKNQIGKKYEVLVENISFDGKYYVARTMQHVPDIDGIVYIKNDVEKNILNTFVEVEIIDVSGYDLIAKI
jgi:tRNA A37 methylthiotransferase MiaB